MAELRLGPGSGARETASGRPEKAFERAGPRLRVEKMDREAWPICEPLDLIEVSEGDVRIPQGQMNQADCEAVNGRVDALEDSKGASFVGARHTGQRQRCLGSLTGPLHVEACQPRLSLFEPLEVKPDDRVLELG